MTPECIQCLRGDEHAWHDNGSPVEKGERMSKDKTTVQEYIDTIDPQLQDAETGLKALSATFELLARSVAELRQIIKDSADNVSRK